MAELAAKTYRLTAGELGAAAAQTVTVALLPMLLVDYTRSATAIGFVIGGEGLFVLLLPPVVGRLSDALPVRLAARFGRRTIFLAIGALLMSLTLIAMPFAAGYWLLALLAFVFFVGLQAYLTPLWTLLVDHIDESHYGAAQGARGVWRVAGLAYGLIVAGFLFDVWRPLPFLVGAALLVITTYISHRAARATARGAPMVQARQPTVLDALRDLRGNRGASWTLIANALWNGGIDGIRPYIFLFSVITFGLTITQVSLGLASLIITLGIGSVVIGRWSDRYSRVSLLQIGTLVGGVAMSTGLVVREVWLALLILMIAGFGMSTVIVAGYPLFASQVTARSAGMYTGLFAMSVGFGRTFAPLLVGAAIDFGKLFFPAERGLPMMWLVAGLLMLLGTWAVRYASKGMTSNSSLH